MKAALPGKKLAADKVPEGVREHDAGGADPARRARRATCRWRARSLLWVSNTESDVFRMGRTGPVYYLVVGPLVLGARLHGPVDVRDAERCRADFKKIPLEHPRSRVLASVPGTQQAAEAVLLAQVPQTARVNKKELKAPDVAYQGEPKFEAIEKTTVARAVNTDKDIIKVGDLYYMCFQGVWFMVEERRPARGRSPARCRRRSTRSRSARRRTT